MVRRQDIELKYEIFNNFIRLASSNLNQTSFCYHEIISRGFAKHFPEKEWYLVDQGDFYTLDCFWSSFR